MAGSTARYSIGIDLGTTNCAVSFVDLTKPDSESQVLLIPQRETTDSVVDRTTMPSFLYLPLETETEQLARHDVGTIDGWVVGEMARRMLTTSPGRVVQSAKSWLGHHSEVPERPILRWDANQLSAELKQSPLSASAAYLGYIKKTWDTVIAKGDDAKRFDKQIVTVTVPASFDAASQNATIEAARLAGFSHETRLLEEPQAAFYRCLERTDTKGDFDELEDGSQILVVDIGGGTTDLSLFRLSKADGGSPSFERIAVSEHLLLGGDNIDLAVAYALESELGSDEDLSSDQWQHLIARSRELKEICLSSESDDELRVALPGSGSSLFAGSKSTSVSSAQLREMLVAGFFADCPSEATPEESTTGLQEWGLPYAHDFVMTRHLAAFVKGKGRIDAVLFNGGSLASSVLRKRLLEQLTEWQGGAEPLVLGNAETDLAVARGAAFYGSSFVGRFDRVNAAVSRSIYLEVANQEGAEELVRVMPQGTEVGVAVEVKVPGLRLTLNQLSSFQAYHSIEDMGRELGDRVAFEEGAFHRLPPLQTEIKLENGNDDGSVGKESIHVFLRSVQNELGLLRVSCVSEDPIVSGEWLLDFNMRNGGCHLPAAPDGGTKLDLELETSIHERLSSSFNKKSRDRLTAAKIFGGLERELKKPRHEWSLEMSRVIGDACLKLKEEARRSTDRLESWFQLTGYTLRPGYGAWNDDRRIDCVWEDIMGTELDLSPGEDVQFCILWRRLSGGLSPERQRCLFEDEFLKLREKKGKSGERIRMLGVLERTLIEQKRRLFDWLLEEVRELLKGEWHVASHLAALGSLLSRFPLYAELEDVVPADWVNEAFETLSKVKWKESRLFETQSLFLRACRIVEARSLNVSSRVSKKVIRKLAQAGVSELRMHPLREFAPMTAEDKATAYGEALPTGLRIM